MVDEKASGGTPLYNAATEALVSDASAISTFVKMITVAYSHSTPETFVKEVHETEKMIKKDFDVKSMPGPWRSAKSVLTTAMKLKISLVDDNGAFNGKTYLQNKIKEAKTTPKDDPTAKEYIEKIVGILNKVPESLKGEVMDAIAEFINSV